MRLQQALLVAIFSFFASTGAENEPAKGSTLALPLPSRSIVGHDGAPGRSLRAGNAIDTEDESTEDRAFLTNVKVRWWLEAEKSDDYVKKALKLDGLKGEALTTNKNYKAFRYFVKKAEGYRLSKWYRHEYNTYQAWKEMGFVKITKASDLDKIRNTDQFRVYKRYVNTLDSQLLWRLEQGMNPPAVFVTRGPSKAELTARTEIMAEAGRSVAYAKVALGMREAPHPNKLKLLYGPALDTRGARRLQVLQTLSEEQGSSDTGGAKVFPDPQQTVAGPDKKAKRADAGTRAVSNIEKAVMMHTKGNGADTSVEEQVQLRRVFRLLAFDTPFQRLDHKLEKLLEKMQGIKSPERQSSRRRYTLSEHDTKCDHYMKEKLKYLATLQDEVNLGRELVTSKNQINTKALMTIYEQLGYPLSGQEKSRLEEVIWQVNDNLDGAISFDEFVNSYVRSRNDRSGLEPSEIF
ncbi:hypothetical protein PR002_g19929, partial [Phytophthora rubi]